MGTPGGRARMGTPGGPIGGLFGERNPLLISGTTDIRANV